GPEGNVDMQSAFAGGLATGLGANSIQHLANGLCGFNDTVKGNVFRVEVEHDVIRCVESPHAGVPRVELDAAEIGQVNESGLVLTKHGADPFAVGCEFGRLDPRWWWLVGDVSLKEAPTLDAVRMSVE